MATPRTRDELLTQFADNNTGAIVEQDHRDLIESALGVYGAHRLTISAAPVSFSFTGGSDDDIDVYDDTVQRAVTGTAAAGALTAPVDGIYRVTGVLRIDAGSALTIDAALAIDGSRVIESATVNLLNGRLDVVLSGVLSLDSGQTLKLVAQTGSADTRDIEAAQLEMTRIG